MAQPFRHYCLVLSERLGYTINKLLSELSSAQIAEYMAFDLLKDEAYRVKLKDSQMSQDEITINQKALFGFRG